MNFKQLICIFTLAATAQMAFAQEKPIKLYPDSVPNSKKAPATYVEKTENNRTSMVTDPVLIPFYPAKDKANGTAIIICPGGGYARLSMDNEGVNIAKKFNEIGITAFILKYRLPSDEIMKDKSIGPLQDAQRSIQLIRQRAAEWGINPTKVGIIGFSAGGHLASTAGTHFYNAVIEQKDTISLRPDFMMLLYPVISFGEMAHKGSMHALLGDNPTPEQIDLYSNEKQVKATTPPTFIVHAEDDKTVPVQNSLMFYYALLANKIPAELHIYPNGGHGFGLNNKTTKDYWFNSATNWLDANGLLKK
ncbi:acetyl esterase/lipase [Mucilaginibacter gracilis]|uniref:Acetyl esterase/lipase n=1 Tax=Mucilaginibacter gracilis TaxID=423350 RepID=A0A495IXI5_9SPHI|nr:alpha/beta hydrolase [Mucilaginibacter gracilis]RKR81417.1 acetyl esterase/lipase [Mucilaginibacter gracilis]